MTMSRSAVFATLARHVVGEAIAGKKWEQIRDACKAAVEAVRKAGR
jgi:hypothetical protein